MAIKRIKVQSKEMEKVILFVKQMTKSMTFDANMERCNWPKQRRRNDLFYKLMPRVKGVTFKKLPIGNKGVLLAESENKGNKNSTDDIVIIYMHGGGFVTGNAYVCKSYLSMLAKYSGCKVYAISYSLAPEHKFPKGFNDCCIAFEEIANMHPNAKIALVGESAGGNFSVALGLKYKEKGNIACVIANSPTIDFSGALDHTLNENKDFIVKLGVSESLVRMYVGDADTKDPYVSPYYGDFNGFPAVFITCDVNETLYADSKALYDKCVEAGVKVEMLEAEGAYHAFAVSGTNTPETADILKNTVNFIYDSCEHII